MMFPSAFEQYLLELTNRARLDPQGEFDALILDADKQIGVTPEITAAIQYFDVDMDVLAAQLNGLTAVAPLAWNGALAQAAEGHSQALIDTDSQSHQIAGGPGILARVQAEGYNANYVAENVFSYSLDALYAHAGFYIDWGFSPTGIQENFLHRVNILNPSVFEVGIGVLAENNSATTVGPYVVTQDFGRINSYNPQIIGVVIDDADGDAFYDIGEGMGGVTVTVSSSTGVVATTSTWVSGGYQIEVAAGTYDVTFSGGGLLGPVTQSVTLGTSNVKVDALAPDTAPVPEPEPVDLRPTLSVSSGSLTVAENVTGALLTLIGNDPEGGALTYSLTGADAADFVVIGNSLSFVTPPDFESPTDGARNNVYNLTAWATDAGGQSATAAVVVTVTDVDETPMTTVEIPDNVDAMRVDAEPDNPGPVTPLQALGTVDNMLLAGNNTPDVLIGGAGHDTLAGSGGADEITGGDGNDAISGSNGNDTLAGGRGDDRIGGGFDNDSISGGDGNDSIGAGMGDDYAQGGTGNDVVNGGAGNDTIYGQAGNDTVGAGFNDDVVSGGTGDDSLGGGTGRDTLFGHGGDDMIGGGAGDDVIDGGNGDDFLAGGDRDDMINGGNGSDTINGGDGNDTLTGGAGADVFVFKSFLSGEVDVITDFADGQDIFHLSGIANAPGTGLAGKLDALDVTDVMIDGMLGASFTYDGQTIYVAGVTAAQLGVDDFVFA